MRTALAGSLSRPCHRADTFITARHSRRSEASPDPPTCVLRRPEARHTCTREKKKPGESFVEIKVWVCVCGGGMLIHPQRVLVQQCGFKEDQRAGITGAGEALRRRASLGHIALLTFWRGDTKRGRAGESVLSRLCAQQVGGWPERSGTVGGWGGDVPNHQVLLFYCLVEGERNKNQPERR